MLKRIDGYWIEILTHNAAGLEFTLPPLPPGTNVYATISLSIVEDVSSDGQLPQGTHSAKAWIDSWTTYLPNGTQSPPHYPAGMSSMGDDNAAGIENCATITFVLQAKVAWAKAQINVFSF